MTDKNVYAIKVLEDQIKDIEQSINYSYKESARVKRLTLPPGASWDVTPKEQEQKLYESRNLMMDQQGELEYAISVLKGWDK